MQSLTPEQQKHLRGLSHSLEPVVRVGTRGLTEAVQAAAAEQLFAHELIKVKLPKLERAERLEIAQKLAGDAGAALVQLIGHVALLYRPRPKSPDIRLPRRKRRPADATPETEE